MQIAILLYEGFTALDAVGPYEVLSRLPQATVHFVARDAGPQRTDTGSLALYAYDALTAIPHPEILVIPGGAAGTYAAAKDQHVLDWLQTAHTSSRWTTSVCTGAVLLGAAGILRGLTATTHWAAQASLESFGATYLPERFVRNGKIITAAGVSAGLDMALYLAGEIAGKPVAQAIQLALEYDPHPPFESGSLQKAEASTRNLALQLLLKQSGR